MGKLSMTFRSFTGIVVVGWFASLSFVTSEAQVRPGSTERVSIASDGTQANSNSQHSSISADGRYVAFSSYASNLVAGDTNDTMDVFLHDRQTGTTSRVSVASDGTEGNFDSFVPSISADGRFVAFLSDASTLVAGDAYSTDVFVHDRLTGVTSLISVASDGVEGHYATGKASISADGRYVAFNSSVSNVVSGDTNNSIDVFVHDRLTGFTSRVSVASDLTEANDVSVNPSLSADGRYVTFGSRASNLVVGDTNNTFDAFVHDLLTGATSRVSVASDLTEGNGDSFADFSCSISADGVRVTFISSASNLVVGDTNNATDVFVHDRLTGVTSRVSAASDLSEANNESYSPSISADGRFIAFFSDASNLVNRDTNGVSDAFVHDLLTGLTSRVSVRTAVVQANGGSYDFTSISADGRYVAFSSDASNLVVRDTNRTLDVFVHDRAGIPGRTGAH